MTIRFSDWQPVGDIRLFRTVTIDHADVHMKLHFNRVSTEPVPGQAFALPDELLRTDD